MCVSLLGRSFLRELDFSAREWESLLDLAARLKADKKAGREVQCLQGRNIALIFEKTSTRTRCSFEVAAYDQGARVTYLDPAGSQLGHKESVADTARVLGRFYDGIEFRGKKQEHVQALADLSGVPVWNGLTDEYHPTQILADLLTMREYFGKLEGLNFVYVGDGRNNMANSLMIGMTKLGVNMTILAPKSLYPSEELVNLCKGYAKESGAKLNISDNLDAVEGADIIYTDVWASMGEEEKAKERIELLKPYQVNKALMDKTGKESTIFMHCLPAVKGCEVTEDVFESDKSVVFDEAENRMHTIKAVMVATLGKKDDR